MPPPLKYTAVADLLQRRIEHGDYALTEIPSERKLAVETCVAYRTLRRAVQQLMDGGLLTRSANGRLMRNPGAGTRRLQVAFLTCATPAAGLSEIYLAVQRLCARQQVALRPVTYVHWDDRIIQDTLTGFDGVFMTISLPGPIPDRVVRRLQQSPHPVAVIGRDLSAWGIPSLCPIPPVMVQRLLDHLEALGHRHIDCLSTQPASTTTEQRIQQWRLWLSVHGGNGRLHGGPAQPQERPHELAHAAVARLLRGGARRPHAIFCTDVWAAVGAMRAVHDAGIPVGPGLSVCAVNGEGLGRFLCPSLTTLEPGDLTPGLSLCLDWMDRGGRGWIGPLLVPPPGVRVVPGGSTACLAPLSTCTSQAVSIQWN